MTAPARPAVPKRDWWSSLNHGGLLIAPARLEEFFGEPLEPLPWKLEERLRRDTTRVKEDEKHIGALLDTVLSDILGLGVMTKESSIDKSWSHKLLTGENYRPNRLWLGSFGDVFPIFVIRARGESTPRLGIGRGRREVSKVIEWLRLADQKVGLLTNGRQFRLIHAGADYDAWCEWDTDLWFEEGKPGLQVEALRQLLRLEALKAPAKGEHSKLVEAILASRRGQAQLSAALGERVRQAVETLIRASAQVIDPLLQGEKPRAAPADLYIAATRMVMRLVVVLFAEARELLPRDNPLYHGSYGLQGLREELDRAAGGRAERLRTRSSAWPRLLGLFRLVAEGSGHEELLIPAYGGGLFEAGKADSTDAVSRALAALESANNVITDDTVRTVLEYLTRSPVKVRQGRGSALVMQPVDFSDLSSEYIGILYEGLLDFELRRVPDNDTFVFLNVGNEPALPMSRLEKMDERALKSLFEKLKAQPSADGGEVDEEENDDEDQEAAPSQDDESSSDSAPDPADVESDGHLAAKQRVSKWARRAVIAAGLVNARRGREPDAAEVDSAQKQLVRRVLASGEWFLVRWGGTRKGAGTFYTRPQLAGPTARRTLQPLAYDVVKEAKDERTGLTEAMKWAPKKPEEILALKVCDPAMGSGSFLVSSLRFLSQALMESLFHHGRIEPKGNDRTICRLADGVAAGHPKEELLPLPKDDPEFQDQLRARLKRHIVEACIYGVDFDPVAVELARLAMWIETMDRNLPFEFLDHKLKLGNALIGCWFDRFQDYPLAAWEREGGDKAHNRFVHHYREQVGTRGKSKGKPEKKGDKWTHAIVQFAAEKIYPELSEQIRSQFQPSFSFGQEKSSATSVHDEARKAVEQMRRLAVHEVERRAELYKTRVRDNEAVKQVRRQFDAWCAVWFWPGDRIADAPRPMTLHTLPENVAAIVDEVAREHRFFHWEIEFPDVFTREGSGFDAIVGNPPWDIQKPNSKEFFSNHDPLYRTYGKQEALDEQEELFNADAAIEFDWVKYQAVFKARSNWVKYAGRPFGDPAEAEDEKGLSLARGNVNSHLHSTWRQIRKKRKGYADPTHPYVHQGSADVNTYKMFLETAHAILRTGGQLGFIVPNGLYTDKGSTHLRDLFLNKCRWQWLFGFENREGIFDIDSRFKFAPIIVQKGGQTEAIRAAFMRRQLEDWETPQDHILAYPRERVEQFSPKSRAILELSSQRDLEVLRKMYSNGVLLGHEGPGGWGIKYATEFHMTNDSKLFPPRPQWEEKGYIPDEYGNWLKGRWKEYHGPKPILERKQGLVLSLDGSQALRAEEIEDVALPLYEGRMIGQFDFSEKGWVSGKGRSAQWRNLPFENKTLEPQFLMARQDFLDAQDREGNAKATRALKLGFMDVSSATNSRTMIASTTFDCPHGNKVPVLSLKQQTERSPLELGTVLNSFVFDFAVRARLGGLTLNWFIVEETALPKSVNQQVCAALRTAALALNCTATRFAPAWLEARPKTKSQPWRSHWAVTRYERMRVRCIVEALVAHSFGVTLDDFAWILRETALPQGANGARLSPKGFWRIDQDQPVELRLPALAYIAYRDLSRIGIDKFLEDTGWQLPDKIRLTELSALGCEGSQEVNVAERLGARLFEWQRQPTSESWQECELHAQTLRTILKLETTKSPRTTQAKAIIQGNLFGS
ncbi:MAG: hypothetical protein JXB05_07890 [Myxococcaceae bacterium]|nr:hypothetical protein [Myxococcaceae bacterium]